MPTKSGCGRPIKAYKSILAAVSRAAVPKAILYVFNGTS